MYKNILLSVDLTDSSSWRNALPFAVEYCQAMGATLHLMTVVPDYGDRFKLYRVATPDMAVTDPFVRYGIKIEPTDDDRYAVADLAVGGLAEQIGLELGDYVTDVDVEQVDLPSKQLVYPFALALLAVVIGLQLGRRRREQATDALATGTAE